MSAAAYFDLARPTRDSSNIMGVVDFRERTGIGQEDNSVNGFIVQLIEGAESAIQTWLGYPVLERICTARYRNFADFQLPFPMKIGSTVSVKYTTINNRQKNVLPKFCDTSLQPPIIRLTGNAPVDVETRLAAPYCVTFETGVPANPEFLKAIKDALAIIVADQFELSPTTRPDPLPIGKIHSAAVRILSPWRKNNY